MPVDTYLGERFRDAGLVTIGKTNMPELGILPTTEPDRYGPSRNPWDTTGLRPVGRAAALPPRSRRAWWRSRTPTTAAGRSASPPSECGLVGLKPTRQRISEGPMIGDNMSGLTVEGVLTRSVRDIAAMLEFIAGPAPGDPYVAPPPLRPYSEDLERDPGPLRIGLMTEQIIDTQVEPVVVEAAENAAKTLEELGHEVDAVEEGAFGADVALETFMTRWMAGQAALPGTLWRDRGPELGENDFERLTWALIQGGRERSADEYLLAVGRHQLLSRGVANWYEAGHDLLLSPTLGELPPPLGTFDPGDGDPLEPMRGPSLTGGFCAPFNVTGQPAISLPLFETDEGCRSACSSSRRSAARTS